jgi:hypothetical protein
MSQEQRALALPRALGRAAGEGLDPGARAEAELRAAVDEVTRLDAEVEALSDALADFSRSYERALGGAFQDLAAAERLVRLLRALEDGLAALLERSRAGAAPPRSPAGRRRKRPAAREPEPPQEDDPPPEIEAVEVALKRVYRRLARVLHPDLAPDDAERARLGDLMARVNADYARGDLASLEVMAERIGAGEPPGELSEEERRAHRERRAAVLARVAASLRRERDRLLRSDTARLREDARGGAGEGGDPLAAARVEIEEEAQVAYADALHRLEHVFRAAKDLSRARSDAMTRIAKRGPTGARRAFDPLEEAAIVRMGAARLERQRATPAARELARVLEGAARSTPWEVALALLAFYAEDAAGRPPQALAAPPGWEACWARVCRTWPSSPSLARMLARLPPHLVLGARSQGAEVVAGVQLADASLLAGVRIAMERDSVAAIAREVLAGLGPEEDCPACGRGPALHLMRTRGLDERSGLVCARCGTVLRSYWRYGEADGLEALAPHALRLGLVAEATAQLAGTAIGFQMLPPERERLTVAGLRRRFAELYLAQYGLELPERAIGVARRKEVLPPGARVGVEGRLRFTIEAAGVTAEGLLELLRARIERRFQP